MPSRVPPLRRYRRPLREGASLLLWALLIPGAPAQEFAPVPLGPPVPGMIVLSPEQPPPGAVMTPPETPPGPGREGGGGTGSPAPAVKWRSTYEQAREQASRDKLPLLLDIGTEACYWCKQLDVQTFANPEIAKLLNKRFVSLKIDARDPVNLHLVQVLRIHSYPTLVFAHHDGRILGYQEGFLDPAAMKEQLLRILSLVTAPEWMKRDFAEARTEAKAGHYARALVLLKGVVHDGQARPTQVEARKLLEEIEGKANTELQAVQELLAKEDKAGEACAAAEKLVKTFEGSAAAREGKQILFTLQARAKAEKETRQARARELLRQAREDFARQRYHCCLDRCEVVVEEFRDLSEAREARQLIADVTGNPEWTRKACRQLGDRLSQLYLAQADTWLKKGQPQQAIFYLERILHNFPDSQHAKTAKVRLLQIQGAPKSPEDDES
jgi:thioredoxin-related protein